MAADKKKIANDCWVRANGALEKEDFEYAVKMYRQSVNLVPENVLFRQSLRGAERRMYKNNGTGAGRLKKAKLLGIRTRCKRARMSSNWDDLDKAAEDGLEVNPWDPQFNADVGDACHHRGFTDAAMFAFEKAHESAKENLDYLASLARLNEEKGDFNRASQIWDRMAKLDPSNPEWRKNAHTAVTNKTIEGGWDEAQSTRDVAATAYDQGENRSVRRNQPEDKDELSFEDQLQRAIRKEPEATEPYLKYADFLRENKRWEEAVENLQTALDISGGDHNVREQLEDCQIEILKHNFDLAKERAANDPDDETARKGRHDAERELLLREMEMLRGRIERYPNDARLKFELGKRLMRFKKFDEAIPLLQQCVNDQRLQAPVLVRLGECFIATDNKGIAARQLDKAVNLLNPLDNRESFLNCHYLLARLAEESKKVEQAEEHYNEILGVDFNYKDVQKRLKKLQAG